MRSLLLALSCLLAAPSVQAADLVSLDSLLHEMVDVEAIARWPQHEFICKQASSYDRAKVAPDKPGWFANNDCTQYIRSEENEGRKEHVMLDASGPGALVRFWLTVGGEKDGVSFTVQGKASGTFFNGYGDKVTPPEPLKLGVFTPEKGRLVLRVEVTGADPKSAGPRYYFGLDCVTLEAAP